MNPPTLAFTLGDPAGIGPEIAVAAMKDRAVRSRCRVLAVGCRRTLARAGWTPRLAPVLEVGSLGLLPRGPSAAGGRLSYAAVRAAVSLCARGLADGLVTAPVCKESWRLARAPHLDHTELLQDLTRAPQVAMMLAAGGLRAVLVTRHIPLAGVPGALREKDLRAAALLAHEALRRDLGIARPRLALCALNPHAGEGGLLGREEETLLKPAAARLRRSGLPLAGPLPADAAWGAHAAGRYDALLALYHDQALIPLKLVGGLRSAHPVVVNWTLGIPLVRTSPGHGTAFDIAWRGRADAAAMRAAALWAAQIVRRRRS